MQPSIGTMQVKQGNHKQPWHATCKVDFQTHNARYDQRADNIVSNVYDIVALLYDIPDMVYDIPYLLYDKLADNEQLYRP